MLGCALPKNSGILCSSNDGIMRDVVDPGSLKEAAAFERICLLRFLYFCDSELSGQIDLIRGFPGGRPGHKVKSLIALPQ